MEHKMLYEKGWVKALAVIITLFIIGYIVYSRDDKNDIAIDNRGTYANQTVTLHNQSQPSLSMQKTITNTEAKIPKYEVVHVMKGKRFDKGVNYYVFLPEVDLSNDNFKKEIKIIIKKIFEENGNKISVDFSDNKESLELLYKLYGDLSLGRTTTKSENEMLAEHAIAAYSGGLTTGLYLNTLYFFPSANKDNIKVGKYVETTEFNPKEYNP